VQISDLSLDRLQRRFLAGALERFGPLGQKGAVVRRMPVARRQVILPLGEEEPYTYSYINSIYNAAVEERHVRLDGKLHITGVASPDIRAVEYFRWPGEPGLVRDLYEQAAPPNDQQQLLIRVTPAYAQQLAGPHWRVDLAQEFADGLVRVSPERLPLTGAIARGWRP